MKEALSIVDTSLESVNNLQTNLEMAQHCFIKNLRVDKSLERLHFEGIDNMSLKENQRYHNICLWIIWEWNYFEGGKLWWTEVQRKWNETAQDWPVNNLRVEVSSQGLIFEDLTTRASKKTKNRENFGSCIIWKFNNHLGAKLWKTGQHEVSRN